MHENNRIFTNMNQTYTEYVYELSVILKYGVVRCIRYSPNGNVGN